MADQTPRFGLDNYDVGEDPPWDHSDLVEFVDESAVEVDEIANRAASGEYDDELFYATDQRILYRWDESANDWVILGGLGSEDQPVDSIYTDKQSITDDVIRVYGVTSGETYEERPLSDYSGPLGAAHQAHLDGADRVELPTGSFTDDTQLVIEGEMDIEVPGQRKCEIDYTATDGSDAIKLGTSSNRAHNSRVSGLKLKGNASAGSAISFNNGQWKPFNITIDHCHIEGDWGGPQIINNGDKGWNITLSNTMIRGGSGYNQLDFRTIGTAIAIKHCRFSQIPTGQYGIVLGGAGIRVESCTITGQQNDAKAGILITSNAQSWVIDSCNIEEYEDSNENATGDGIHLETGWKDGSIENTVFGHMVDGVKPLGDATSASRRITVQNWGLELPISNLLNFGNAGLGRVLMYPFDTTVITNGSGQIFGQDGDGAIHHRAQSGNRWKFRGGGRDFTTVSAGSTATISTGIGNETPIMVGLESFNNSADTKVEHRKFWDNSAGEWKIEVEEVGGTNSADVYVYWVVIERNT